MASRRSVRLTSTSPGPPSQSASVPQTLSQGLQTPAATPVVQDVDMPQAQAPGAPVKPSNAVQSSSSVPDLCSICLTDLERRGGRAILNPGCGHELHLSCFTKLMANNPSAKCPTCRQKLGAHMSVAPGAVVAGPPASTPSGPLPAITGVPNFMFNVTGSGGAGPQPALQSYPPFNYTPRRRNYGFFGTLPTEYNPAGDDPVEPAMAGPSSSRQAGQSYDYSRIVTLKLDPETDPVTAAATKVTAMLSMNIGADPNESEDRNAIDMVLCVDKSGSMSGHKMQHVKDTLRYILDALSPEDRISIVLFNDEARILCGLKRLSVQGKQEIARLIESVDADGGTTIAGGLDLALNIIQGRQQKNKSSAVLLLSDGQDMLQSRRGAGLSPYERLKERAQTLSCPVFTFGIGADHDANCLTTLSAQGGTFTFVDTMQMVIGAFAGAVGALKGIAIKDCTLTLEVPRRNGFRIAEVLSGYPVESRTENKAVIKFSDAYYEEERNILLVIDLPESHPERQQILKSSATFTILDTNASASAESGVLEITRADPASLPANPVRNMELMRHKLRIHVSQALSQALAVADDGNDFTRARQILNTAREQVRSYLDTFPLPVLRLNVASSTVASDASPESPEEQVKSFLRALLEDIDRSIRTLQDRSSLEQGGRAYMQSTVTSNMQQRSVTADMQSASTRSYVSKKARDYSAKTPRYDRDQDGAGPAGGI